MIKVGTLIEFESGMQYEVTKVFSQTLVDLKAVKPQFEWMPDYYPEYFSVQLKDYKILPNELKGVSNNEQNIGFCKGDYNQKGTCLKYTGMCTYNLCDYWQK